MAALGAILADAALEPAFIALTLTPPSEPDIAREIGHDVDPDAIFAARRQLRATIGERLGGDACRQLPADDHAGPLSAGCQERRTARAQECLSRSPGGDGRTAKRSISRWRNIEGADNMTDRMAALEILTLHDRPERAQALEDFYTRYADDPLIIDKWLALQAAIPEAATLDRVRALTSHPAFSMANPNRVRALIGSFAQVNHTQFNRIDGAGYDFVADVVLMLDREEPAGRRAADGRIPFLARTRSDAAAHAPRRLCAASPRRPRSRATSTTSWRARWRIAKRRRTIFDNADRCVDGIEIVAHDVDFEVCNCLRHLSFEHQNVMRSDLMTRVVFDFEFLSSFDPRTQFDLADPEVSPTDKSPQKGQGAAFERSHRHVQPRT